MVGLCARAACNKVARILALEAVIRVLNEEESMNDVNNLKLETIVIRDNLSDHD